MTAPAPDIADAEPDLAAEHALGVLDDADRAEAERRMLADPAFTREVEAWRWRLARLTEETAAREPPAHVWAAIARQLEPLPRGGVVEFKLRRDVAIWRGLAMSAAAIAAGLALALVMPRLWPRPVAPPLPSTVWETARLSGANGGAVAFVAVLDPARHELVLTPATTSRTPTRAPQLWVIPLGGKPISLGVAAFGRSVRLPVDARLGAQARRTLAVSLEPQGGSPTGQPTGPVVATGELQTL